MAKTIGVFLQKGGVGKSTTAASLAWLLAMQHARVLLVDCEAQGDCSRTFGVQLAWDDPMLYEVLLNPTVDPAYAIQTHYGVDLIPASERLTGADAHLVSAIGRELRLQKALAHVQDRYDYIILDAPPSLATVAVNVLAAADTILVPLQVQQYALDSMRLFNDTLTEVQQINPGVHIGGIVLTMYDARTSINPAIAQAARDAYGDLVFETTIPFATKVNDAAAARLPLPIYAPKSTAALAYASLADEVLARWPMEVSHA